MQQQTDQAPARGRDLGQALRRARQRRRSSLDDASRETRISVTYLSALESGAPLSAFPAPVYARGFLREYARYLGLDPEKIVDRMWDGDTVPDPVVQSSLGHPSQLHGDRPRGFRGQRGQLRLRGR